MAPMRRALALLALAVPLLGGCATLPRMVPMNASGMQPATDYLARATRDQVRDTRARLEGFPHDLAAHLRGSWRALMEKR